ncbi:MAG: hypothetical protein J7501_16100 [Bdellovibrio sp.]|nr:hypothetical protein [Bdellovibrio sp.]
MKMLFAGLCLISTSMSFAGTTDVGSVTAGKVCGAYYAAGMGHVFKGEMSQLGDIEKVAEGQSSGDDLYTVTVKDGEPTLIITKTGQVVPLSSQDLGLKVYSTSALQLYPSGVPGTQGGNKFIVILCAPAGTI